MSFENVGDRSGGRGTQLPSLKLVGLLIVVALLAVWFVQNGQEVTVELLWAEVTWPVRLIILIAVIFGVLLDRLGSYFWRRSRRGDD